MVVLQFLDGTIHTPHCDDAYVRVRLNDPRRTEGEVTVYLDDGTALVVPERDLVKVAATEPRR
jgi:hypothetical protein